MRRGVGRCHERAKADFRMFDVDSSKGSSDESLAPVKMPGITRSPIISTQINKNIKMRYK